MSSGNQSEMAGNAPWAPVTIPATLGDNTPVGTPSKRTLSDCSTPSPSSAVVNQEPKKAKLPCSDLSLSDQPSTTVEPNPGTTNTIQSIMEAMQDQIKATIAEHVRVSVTAMANSVATIISQSLNDRINSVEAENQRLSDQVTLLTEKVDALETYKFAIDQKFDAAEQYSRRACLRLSGIP